MPLCCCHCCSCAASRRSIDMRLLSIVDCRISKIFNFYKFLRGINFKIINSRTRKHNIVPFT
ncbi:hypothetical protein PUN28_010561 [Cardiocondyla obscurior]|uniref:Uncharacterized protein n=1 Tax=Cardiocondyla obscurior TaxID=286306 RepID=A0AAW2FMB4_9HYME